MIKPAKLQGEGSSGLSDLLFKKHYMDIILYPYV